MNARHVRRDRGVSAGAGLGPRKRPPAKRLTAKPSPSPAPVSGGGFRFVRRAVLLFVVIALAMMAASLASSHRRTKSPAPHSSIGGAR